MAGNKRRIIIIILVCVLAFLGGSLGLYYSGALCSVGIGPKCSSGSPSPSTTGPAPSPTPASPAPSRTPAGVPGSSNSPGPAPSRTPAGVPGSSNSPEPAPVDPVTETTAGGNTITTSIYAIPSSSANCGYSAWTATGDPDDDGTIDEVREQFNGQGSEVCGYTHRRGGTDGEGVWHGIYYL